MRLYRHAFALFLLLFLRCCLAGEDDDDNKESEDVDPAIAACLPIYTALNTLTSQPPQHPRLLATEIRHARNTTCCARHPPCCSQFDLKRIYELRIFFWSMEKSVASSWLLGFSSNSRYSIDKMVGMKTVPFIYFKSDYVVESNIKRW